MGDSADPSAYTYRNGVNYKKINKSLMMEYSANIPRNIYTKYL